MGTLGNVPLASAHGRCTVAALSCIKWKAHHKFHVSLVACRHVTNKLTKTKPKPKAFLELHANVLFSWFLHFIQSTSLHFIQCTPFTEMEMFVKQMLYFVYLKARKCKNDIGNNAKGKHFKGVIK